MNPDVSNNINKILSCHLKTFSSKEKLDENILEFPEFGFKK